MAAAVVDDGRPKFNLRAGTKVCDFTLSDRFVDIIIGPLGSGKTRALCARIMRHAQQQAASPIDGLRRTRFALVRNTHPDLRRTTIRTWLDMFPERIYGRFNYGQALQHHVRFGDVQLEVDFISLDKAEDVRRLRSTEYTGVAFNELPFIIKEIFDEATGRLRYPGPEHGGPTWRGIIADGNAPDEDHWLAQMTGMIDLPPGLTDRERTEFEWPSDWGFYLQPPALIEEFDARGNFIGYETNPCSENLENLPADYYKKQIVAKSKAWIDSRLMCRVALVVEGSPVWPMFRTEVHVSREPLRPIQGHLVIVGLDFGRSPAAIFIQSVNHRVLVQYELLGANEGAVSFAPKVKRFLVEHYPNFTFRCVGDPKGQDRTQNDERTAYEIFAANGLPVMAAPGLKQNMISTRVEAVSSVLLGLTDQALPRFMLSPLCRSLKVAMAGRYHNERDEQGELRPCKDRYSHPSDALQYAVLGAGEGSRMIGLVPEFMHRPIQTWKRNRSMRRVVA